MPFNLGLGEVLVVLVVALLVFGGRLPEVGRSLGRGLSEFRRGIKGLPAPEEKVAEKPKDDSQEPTPGQSP